MIFEKKCIPPEYKPPIGVRTPLAAFTALLEKEPVPGNAWKNELPILHNPIATNSCVASTGFPKAKVKKKNTFHWSVVNRYSVLWFYWQNVLHMERFSINAIIGKTITPEPMSETISKNPIVVPLSLMTLNFGKPKSGKPDGILPGT